MNAAIEVDAATQRDHPVVAKAPERAPTKDERDDRMRVLDSLERLDGRAPACLRVADDGQLELFEEHAPELLRRVDVERMPSELVNLPFEVAFDLRECDLGSVERGRIDDDARQLHA